LGGVVNIITRQPGKKMEGNLKLTSRLADGDSHNDGDGHDIDFNISGGATDNLQFSVGAQQSRRSSVESKLNPGQSAIEGREKQQLSLGLDWQPADNHNIKLEYSMGQEDRWQDTATRTNTLYQSQYDIDRDQLSLGWKGTIDNITSSLRAYQSKVDIINTATNGVVPTAPQKLTDTVMEGNISVPLGEKHLVTAGLEHRIEELKNPNLTNGKDDFTLNSVYVQDEIDLTENTLITLGTRFDDHESFGNEVSPRASIVWNATDRLILKGSYGHGFRAPNIKQVSPGYTFPLGIFVIASNPDLKPETNDAVELGANYSTERFSINTALFDNKVKNLIDTRFDSFLPGGVLQRWTYDNIEKARLKGAEISTKVQLREGLQLTSSYQYLDAKDGAGQRLERRPRHTLSAGILWEKNSWKLNLNAEHLADQLIEKTRVVTEVPDYTVWNIGVRKSINKNIEFAAGIENLTDVRLEDKSAAFRHEEYPRTLRLEIKAGF
jgi:outer membrane receptor for ferrienterochelin and colicins